MPSKERNPNTSFVLLIKIASGICLLLQYRLPLVAKVEQSHAGFAYFELALAILRLKCLPQFAQVSNPEN